MRHTFSTTPRKRWAAACLIAFGVAMPATADTDPRFPTPAAWRVVIYYDPALTGATATPSGVEALAEHAEDLAALGTVEVVRSVTAPQALLRPSRNPAEIREAIDALATPAASRETLTDIRQAFLATTAAARFDDPIAVRDRVRQSARREVELLRERLAVLQHFVTTRPAAGAATALLWITDGFEAELSEFYVRALGGRLRSDIEGDLDPHELHFRVDELVRELAAARWTILTLTAHGDDDGALQGLRPWVDGDQPLRLATARTGGAVVARVDGIPALLASIERHRLATYQVGLSEAEASWAESGDPISAR